MDKAILKKFAVESRQDLMDKIRNKIKTFYIDEDFNSEQKGEVYVLSNEKHSLSLTNDEFKKRELLIKRVRELSLEQVIEEAAYTWFNRIIAIRYMEINDMLPLTKDNQSLGIRVLSSKDNTPDPEILKFTNLMNPELDIDFKKEKYMDLKNDNEKFKYILLLICRKLGKVIPQVFDGVTDYIDILIPDNLLNDTGFITKVIKDVPENNYNQVEIVGWLYQYYNQTEKDRVISSKKTYKKNEIAYATQLFTPDWIVKYMVENSLGKYWIEHNSAGNILINKWKYLIKDNLKKAQCDIIPDNITFIDPCCGSGHILVYAFELLYDIYCSVGFNKNDICEKILENNLFGVDIDDRAGQLSVLSVILKAREYDKNIFNKAICKNINIFSMQESNNIVWYFDSLCEESKEKLNGLIEVFKNAKEIGSLIKIEKDDYSKLINEIKSDETIFGMELKNKAIPLIKQAIILSNKYSIVVTNPPYLNSSVMTQNLKDYVNKFYKLAKSDLFSAFILRNIDFGREDSYLGFMTPYVWMFISSYEELRSKIINELYISSLIQMEYSALEEAIVPLCSFVLSKEKENGIFFRLTDFTGGMKVQEQKFLEAQNENCKYKYLISKDIFMNIPGKPIAYWIPNKLISIYKECKLLGEDTIVRNGMKTGDNNRFLRFWWEVANYKLNTKIKNYKETLDNKYKWFPYNKGGEFRKWYGNEEYVVNWENQGEEIFNNAKKDKRNVQDYPNELKFIPAASWSLITSSRPAFRLKENNLSDIAGMCFYKKDYNELLYYLGFCNSKIALEVLKMLAPTINFQSGDIARLPILIKNCNRVVTLVESNISLSKDDWNDFETSWDFKKIYLVKNHNLLEEAFIEWKKQLEVRFNSVKTNEQELNDIFVDNYGLKDSIDYKVIDKDITIRIADKERDIKSLISYAVGCMFGRYSLDKDGLIYAGGDFDNVYQKYKKTDGGWAGSSLSNYKYLNDNGNEIELSFEVDNDNIIPITDEAYFSDDIVERFKTFIKTVYGDNTFNENMDFIAEALGKKGTETSEETIRRYFVNDFFNDHVKMYQKRPIYWLLDSGKKNGFKALVYMHRYNENLIPKARLDYLHRVQTTYEKLLSDVNYKLTTDLSMTDKKEAKNRQADLNAKLNEIKEYDEKIAHIANQRISIDLDDGVKVNYEKFKDILAKIK